MLAVCAAQARIGFDLQQVARPETIINLIPLRLTPPSGRQAQAGQCRFSELDGAVTGPQSDASERDAPVAHQDVAGRSIGAEEIRGKSLKAVAVPLSAALRTTSSAARQSLDNPAGLAAAQFRSAARRLP